jgi:hypothetical protein
LRVAHQDARQQSRLAGDLEAVADPEHEAAAEGVLADCFHDGGPGGDGSAAQVIAVGEAAWQHHEIGARGERMVLVPGHRHLRAGGSERPRDVGVAVGAREGDDGGAHQAISTR